MIQVSPDSEISTAAKAAPATDCQDVAESCDWETLSGWFLGLCLWAEPLLPAALWLVCSCRPALCGVYRPTASDAALVDELAAALGAERTREPSDPPLPAGGEHGAPALSWRRLAQALRSLLLAKPAVFRLALWSGVQFVRRARSELRIADPAEDEIRVLLDYLDVNRPDALPIARRMLATIPSADGVLERWQPRRWQPKERAVTKIVVFFSRVHRAAARGGGEAPGLENELRRAEWELADGDGDRPLADLPAGTLDEVERIIDDPSLALAGKVRAISQALKEANGGAVAN